MLVSRTLAFTLDDSAVALLFLASRLVELPLGIFTIAVTTVIFPQIAKLQVQKEHGRFRSTFQKGLLWILVLTIPAAVGLAVLSHPILDFLFNWGLFDDAAVGDTVPILQISAIGLPFYSAVAMYTRGFHAQEDMQRPLKGSVHVLVANLVLSLVLMQFYGVFGLAAAGVLATLYQCIYLHRFRSRQINRFECRPRQGHPIRCTDGGNLPLLLEIRNAILGYWETSQFPIHCQPDPSWNRYLPGLPMALAFFGFRHHRPEVHPKNLCQALLNRIFHRISPRD